MRFRSLRVQEIARLGMLRTFQTTRIYGKMNCMQNMLISIPHRKASFFDMFAERDEGKLSSEPNSYWPSSGLYEKRFLRAGSLSFGQQKLLEFAMALMNEPTVLLLDEPTAGINPTLINGLIDRLKRANTEFGITLFIIEHNMRAIMNMASYDLLPGARRAAGRRAIPPKSSATSASSMPILEHIDDGLRTGATRRPVDIISVAWIPSSRSTRWRVRPARSRAW